MAVALRLKMMGTKHRPFYRIVALDSRKTRDGMTLANLGQYAPLGKEATIEIDEEQALDFLNKGAVPSETVRSLLKKKGIVREYRKNENGKSKIVWVKRGAEAAK